MWLYILKQINIYHKTSLCLFYYNYLLLTWSATEETCCFIYHLRLYYDLKSCEKITNCIFKILRSTFKQRNDIRQSKNFTISVISSTNNKNITYLTIDIWRIYAKTWLFIKRTPHYFYDAKFTNHNKNVNWKPHHIWYLTVVKQSQWWQFPQMIWYWFSI